MGEIDERYKRGKIYTVRCRYDDSLIYVGSTIDILAKRMGRHRTDKKCSLYKQVDGDWNNWYIELYEEFPCNNKQLLEKREGEVIREIATINNRIEGRTYKEWREDNREKILEQRKEYYENNSEKIAEQKKEYYENNSEKIAEQKKEYYENNSEKIAEQKKEYYQNNREKILEKVICDHCGCEISKKGLKQHQKSKKCMNYNK
jgi:hypothetical protein